MSGEFWHRYRWTPATSLSAQADAWLNIMWGRLVLVAVLVALLVIVVPVYGAGAAVAATGGQVISVPCVRVDPPAGRREPLVLTDGPVRAAERSRVSAVDQRVLVDFD
ncbi:MULTISPECIES: hypothetical protein [Gordonia]|uniref:Methyltransferase n=1 Tax=Gordonia amicalis TaxID=89053 RepID=A0AAE4U099_9ACTN|nr:MULTISPECIES: hypothetical protein [Gordonia]ATD70218.1 methyltransferase [Gordonia sp. 1D]KAF0967354.1 hypothetical protein BPODLACK_04169 [Gordonia sp. YY1]MBA5849152.1 methyltransferase [Gordonia amicalis]MCR8897030.1 methyltransferase [Gordonia sp. GONU]MCZ0912319.1 methyltransferase [Gordonia amicalis]